MKKKEKTQIAKCLCGGVKIKIFGKLRHVINCHCKQCMKTHGNFAAYTNCLEENIIFMNKSAFTLVTNKIIFPGVPIFISLSKNFLTINFS